MLVEGQKLWFVGSHPHRHNRGGQEVTVEKVGRKWATISAGADRIDKTTLRADGGGYTSPGQCYLSEAEYEAEKALSVAWSEFAALMDRWRMPSDMTLEKITKAREVLGLAVTPAVNT